ncbi:heme-degrading domain-containing protein [Archangium sp.]|uniref:heme-degrading domain-containing protein n=1 Tax=Archangium sp. TaxID=1872627 RepID=UPI002D4AC1A4|nr:heme-degrading domain-containing protein [Archangium sp.]HYO59866.1 heme-degrading domain-containing protein [Archangium sp.]
MSGVLEQLLAEESELQFDRLSHEDALALGLKLLERARLDRLPVVIDVTLAGLTVLHCALPGSRPDNHDWVRRKKNTVNRFWHSSYYVGRYYASKGMSLSDKPHIDPAEYVDHGGSFPLLLRDTGCIGSITVSGLAQEDDHALVVGVLREWLASRAGRQ